MKFSYHMVVHISLNHGQKCLSKYRDLLSIGTTEINFAMSSCFLSLQEQQEQEISSCLGILSQQLPVMIYLNKDVHPIQTIQK
jgi:hypothetical protein